VLILHGTVVSFDPGLHVLYDGSVRIRRGLIECVCPSSQTPEPEPREEVIDAEGMLVMPGMVNLHTHLARAVLRFGGGLDRDAELAWQSAESLLDYDGLRNATLAGCAEAIRCGTTTTFDAVSAPPTMPYALDCVAEAVLQSGLRVCASLATTDRFGVSEARVGVDQNMRLGARRTSESLLVAAMGLDLSVSVTNETLAAAVQGAALRDMGFHVAFREFHGLRQDGQPVGRSGYVFERLRRIGVLGPRTLLVHTGELTDEEALRVIKARSLLVHCPQSGVHSDIGRPDIRAMLDRGLDVGVGTNGYSGDVFRELFSLYLLHRADAYSPRSLDIGRIVRMCLVNSARIASRALRIPVGTLREGSAGDVILVKGIDESNARPERLPWVFVMGMDCATVDTTIVGGSVLMRHGELQTLDAGAIARRCRDLVITQQQNDSTRQPYAGE